MHPASIAGAIFGAVAAIVGLAWVLWSLFQLLKAGFVITDLLLRALVGKLPRSHWRCGVLLASFSFVSGFVYSSGLAGVLGLVVVVLLATVFLSLLAVTLVGCLVACIRGSTEYRRSQTDMVVT